MKDVMFKMLCERCERCYVQDVKDVKDVMLKMLVKDVIHVIFNVCYDHIHC